MILLIKLLTAHFIGDFILQTDRMVRSKEEGKLASPMLYIHVLIHAVLSVLVVWTSKYWMAILIIVLSHFIIDAWKLYYQNESNKRELFILDQAMHILVIVCVTQFYTPWMNSFLKLNYDEIMLLVLVIVLITVVSSHIIKVIISKWQPENEDQDRDSLSNAGKYIGILERLFVFGFIVSGNMQGIGFLLAAKSVFRFGDLKDSIDRKLTEYILIGTLLSFGIAMLLSYTFLILYKEL